MFRTGVVVVVIGAVAWYTGVFDNIGSSAANPGAPAVVASVARCGEIMADFVAGNAESPDEVFARGGPGDSIGVEDFARVARTGASLAQNEAALEEAGCTSEFMNANSAQIQQIMDRGDPRFNMSGGSPEQAEAAAESAAAAAMR